MAEMHSQVRASSPYELVPNKILWFYIANLHKFLVSALTDPKA